MVVVSKVISKSDQNGSGRWVETVLVVGGVPVAVWWQSCMTPEAVLAMAVETIYTMLIV